MKLTLPDSGAEVLPDGRSQPPSALRNADAILAVLLAEAPRDGRMLELAAGSGLHSAAFSTALPGLIWQPTDVAESNFRSITAWAATGSGQVQAPVRLDATRAGWAVDWPGQDAVLLVNLLHLIPVPAAAAVLAEIAAALALNGTAFVYGPFLRDGQTTSPGDAAFDASLRAQDPRIGYKDLAWAVAALQGAGLTVTTRDMPANNVMLIARR